MKVLTVALFTLFSLTLSAQNVLIKGKDTIALTGEQTSYYIDLLNAVSPEELHFICISYDDRRFNFENEKDLIATMSGYTENDDALDWVLTRNEKILLKKFEKIQFREWKNSKRKPSNNISAGDHLQRAGRYKNASIAVLVGSGTTTYALIAADPINGPSASIIGVAGGLVSLGLNIAGNMELIAAGKAMNKE